MSAIKTKKGGDKRTFKQKTKDRINQIETRTGDIKQGDHKIIDLSPNITQSIKGSKKYLNHFDGMNSAKVSEAEMKKIAPITPNVLNQYRTVNTIFTLAALDFTEVNFPETLRYKAPNFVIAKSGGGGSRVANAVDIGGNTILELFVDQVNIDALVSPSPKNRHAQATGVSFKIIEPYSMGKFLEVLHLGALLAADDADGQKNTNHYNSPYALIIDFVPEGDFRISQEEQTFLKKIIPIKITSADFGVTAGGSTYDITAIPWNEAGFDDAVVNIPHDITLKGSTVHEVLSTGEKSLMNQLNSRKEPKPEVKKKRQAMYGSALRKKKKEKSTLTLNEEASAFMKQRKPNDYVVWFPQDSQLITKNTAPEFTNVDRATFQTDHPPSGAGHYVTSLKNTAVRDEQLETIFGGRLSLTNSLNEGVQIKVSVGGDMEMSWYDGNDIGKSKMVTDSTFYEALGGTMPDPKDDSNMVSFEGLDYLYDKKHQLYKRNKITFNPEDKNFTFEAGTRITDIIEQVILLSDYGKNITDKETKDGTVDWFRIQPKVFQLQDSAIAQSYGFHPKVYAYTVINYKVMSNLFLSPTQQAGFLPQIKSKVKKEYNYFYSGKNLDVLDFDLSFKFAFYQPGMSDKGDAPLNQTEAGKDATVNSAPRYGHGTGAKTNKVAGEGTAAEGGNVNEGFGSKDENPFIRIARHYNNVIVNSNVDLVSCELTIMGDPYWMPNSGLGNYIAAPYKTDDKGNVSAFMDSDGNADFTRSQVMCLLNFRTPYDYEGSKMAFPSIQAQNKSSEKIGQFSGLYRIWFVKNEFVSGKFVQVLSMLRVNNQPGAEEGKKTNVIADNSISKIDDNGYIFNEGMDDHVP